MAKVKKLTPKVEPAKGKEKAPRKGSSDNPLKSGELDELKKKSEADLDNEPVTTGVVEAHLKDGKCVFHFEILTGKNRGSIHKVTNCPGLYEDDLKDAFASFNVHMACICDIFKHAKVEIDDITIMDVHELALLFTTTGMKITGAEDDRYVILSGNMYISGAGGRIEIKTPKIPLDNSSSYKWSPQLREIVEIARQEVELYQAGKFTLPKEPEKKPKHKQTKIEFGPGDPGKNKKAKGGKKGKKKNDDEDSTHLAGAEGNEHPDIDVTMPEKNEISEEEKTNIDNEFASSEV